MIITKKSLPRRTFLRGLGTTLALPLLGNLPARFIGGVITFYCSLVVACILGLALHKCAGRLNIPTD